MKHRRSAPRCAAAVFVVILVLAAASAATGGRFVLASGPVPANGLPFMASNAIPCLYGEYVDYDEFTRWRDYPRIREYREPPAPVRVWLVSGVMALPAGWQPYPVRLAFEPNAELLVDRSTGVRAVRLPSWHLFLQFPEGFAAADAFVSRFVDRLLFFSRPSDSAPSFPAVVEVRP